MYRTTLLTLGIFAFGLGLSAQSRSPSVISTGGGTAVGNKIILEWTLGDLAVQSIRSSTLLITEGFHQPFLLKVETVDTEPFAERYDPKEKYRVSLHPNPALATLIITLQGDNPEKTIISLLDANGKLIQEESILPFDKQATMDVSALVPGLYYVPIRNSNGDIIKTFKVSKM